MDTTTAPSSAPGAAFPLVFTFRDLLAGRGFFAAIETTGRVILAREDSWTIYGVNPGGVAGVGENRAAALADFRQGYSDVLDDVAHEASDFAAFKAAVEALVHQTNEDTANEWAALREQVRAGRLTLDELPRYEGEVRPRVTVQLVEPTRAHKQPQPSPELNRAGVYAEAA